MSILDIDIASIARGLRVRQKLQVPTLLFLGARAGALFHSQTFYDELSSFSSSSLATLDQIEKFQSCVRLLEQDRFSNTDIHYILLRSLQDAFVQHIDQYVAVLAKLNFFQLIVTTNIDVGLEAAFSRIGLRMKSGDFDVFVPSADPKYVNQSSSSVPSLSPKHVSDGSPLFTLVKLYGELAMGRYNLKNRGEFFESNSQLYQQLRNMRNWNILMVGFDPVWDAAIVPILFPCAGKLWYVNEETPSQDAQMFKYVQFRNAECLLGAKGNSDTFFHSLYQHIVGSTPLPLFDSQAEALPAESRQSAPPPSTRKVEESRDRKKSPSTTQYKVDVLLLATTERELTALLKECPRDINEHIVQGRTYYDLGTVGDASVFLMQADEMKNAHNTLGKQIQELSPACIIILGTAWGFKYKGQSIGNLLIPDRILISDVERENRNGTPTKTAGTDSFLQVGRHQKEVPTRLLNLFKNGSLILNRKTKRLMLITFGPIFSSTKAIDKQTAFRYVSRTAPSVIGIETGATALFSLAQRYQDNCLVVNGISALVDVDETMDQGIPNPESILENAAQFILNVIALGGFHNTRV